MLAAAGCSTTSRVSPVPEVTVSSANYVTTPIDEIAKYIDKPSAMNPAPPALQALAKPQVYLLVPGEIYPSDLTFPAIGRQVEAALAPKGYLNAATELRAGRTPVALDLVLRVHCGQRPWRRPVIRVDELTWNEGLLARHRLASAGGGAVTLWDYRAGGDDFGLYLVEDAVGASSDATHPLNGLASSLTGEATRDYFLLVVDAFSFAELKAKRGEAKRLWTTFVAVPKQGNQKFSDVLAGLLKTATPYFGETTRGIQVFDEDHAQVKIGVPYEVPMAPAAPPPDPKR